MNKDGFTLRTFSQVGEPYQRKYFQENLLLGTEEENSYLEDINKALEEDGRGKYFGKT